jgi:hypothetical protein
VVSLAGNVYDMLARHRLQRRIDGALAAASPLDLAQAIDAHICALGADEVHALLERSVKRMDPAERRQLELYLDPRGPDDLFAHRFSAFLRQNPRSLAALDQPAIDAILERVGELPRGTPARRALPGRVAAVAALVVCVTFLPLAAQYTHQRGILEGLTDPVIVNPLPAVFHRAASPVKHRPPPPAPHAALRAVPSPVMRVAEPRHVAAVRRLRAAPRERRRIAAAPWKYDRRDYAYFNHRAGERYAGDSLALRSQTVVRSYLQAVIDGNLKQALKHLGMPATADVRAIAELPIISRASRVAIVGSRPQSGGNTRVEADIQTGGHEYFEVFTVTRDGPAVRIADHYYIPVNSYALRP